ncbi:MAG: FAD-binding oxidoreductase [Spirochaetia bacterium]
MTHSVRVLGLDDVTHDTKRLVLERPPEYRYEPGQSVEIAVDKPDWGDEFRPFSFTSVEEDEYLEFIIKIYPAHEGVTKQIAQLTSSDRIRLSQPFGSISYRDPGYFIAGGSGITPLLSILRRLHRDGRLADNKLLYSNRTEQDIIRKFELDYMLGNNVVYNVTHAARSSLRCGVIRPEYLARHAPDISRPFYLCGPDEMVRDVRDMLGSLGAKSDSIVFQE